MTDQAITRTTSWRNAIVYGTGAALLHKIFLVIWMPLVWLVLGTDLDTIAHNTADAVPLLATDLEKLLFGVWRRWDTIHYFDLALGGYHPDNIGPTVFGVLTPVTFRAFDVILPGGIDLAAMVVGTLAFVAALILLYRVVEVYYDDANLARWSLIVTALAPLSYFYNAPMSESLYLALALATFYAAFRQHWWLAAICGALATLARSQGAVLIVVAGLIALEKYPISTWPGAAITLAKRSWMLMLIPLALVGFQLWRLQLGLPSLTETYRNYSYNFMTDPLSALWINVIWVVENPETAITNIDTWALVVTIVLAVVALRYPVHRRLPLVIYSFAHISLFVAKINYVWGTDIVGNSQSVGRYSLALFPLLVLVADLIRNRGRWGRAMAIGVLATGFILFSAFHALGIGPA